MAKEMAKHVLVRTSDQVEHFHGENLKAYINGDGHLEIREGELPCGLFKEWLYVRSYQTPHESDARLNDSNQTI